MKSAVVDTNVIIRGLIGSGSSRAIYHAFKTRRFKLFISPLIFREIIRVVNKPKLRALINPEECADILQFIQTKAAFVTPRQNVFECRDPGDNIILECALEAKVDFIITHDKDLLVLESFRDIPLLSPKEFLVTLKE